MSRALVALFLALTVAPQLAAADSSEPEVYGVLFYADWCGSCKVLDPAIQKARGQSDLDNEPVLFIRLDLTDATRRYQAGLMANALGLSEFYDKNAGATGFLLLVDAESKEVIKRLTKTMDARSIAEEVRSAIEQASG